jgi:MFS family permease
MTKENSTTATVEKIGHYRWTIVALLLFSTTFNYLDRQVISYLKPYFCSPEGFGWTNTQFSILTSFFTGFYGLMTIIAGVVIDKIGTKLGLALSLIVWSIFGVLNAFVGSVLVLHLVVRSFFGIGEAGNFPASIKTIAEWFPKKERALATSIFNSGSNLGAMIAALLVPWCMTAFKPELGWKMAFILTGAIGFIWLFFWFWLYDSPSKSKFIKKPEFDYINSDDIAAPSPAQPGVQTESSKPPGPGILSFSGRMNRASFWGNFIMANIICVFLISVMWMMIDKKQLAATAPKDPLGFLDSLQSLWVRLGHAPQIFIGCVAALYIWWILSLQSKRLHDLGKSGAALWINLIPGLGTLYLLLSAGFAKDSVQDNSYGAEARKSLLAYRQTWSFFVGKFFTDGVWWFYLFWLPDYLMKQFNMTLSQVMWPTFIVYFVSIVGSVFGGSIPLLLINRGMPVYKARMTAMILIAIAPLAVLTTQYFGNVEHFGKAAMYFAVTIISIGAAAHQAWSANMFTTVSDMFPKKAVGTVTGIGAMAGGLGGVLILMLSGVLRDAYADHPQTAYFILFVICSMAYLTAWSLMKLLVPSHKPITDL